MGSSLVFRPHAIIATDRSVPSPIFVAALIRVEKILRIDFDTSLLEETFVQQALAKLPEQTIAFGRPIGVTVNFSPDRSEGYPQCPLRNHAKRATDMDMAFHRLKDRDWLDYATLAFVAALSVGLRFRGPSRFPFRGVLTQLPKPN